MITIEEIEKIYEEIKPKPDYHFECYGGGLLKVVDFWGNKDTLYCINEGIKDWATPACENCDGILEGNWQLTDRDRYEELGMRKLLNAIMIILNS